MALREKPKAKAKANKKEQYSRVDPDMRMQTKQTHCRIARPPLLTFLISAAPPLTTPSRLVGLCCSSFLMSDTASLLKWEGKFTAPCMIFAYVFMGSSS